jgi:hypothetical protein
MMSEFEALYASFFRDDGDETRLDRAKTWQISTFYRASTEMSSNNVNILGLF